MPVPMPAWCNLPPSRPGGAGSERASAASAGKAGPKAEPPPERPGPAGSGPGPGLQARGARALEAADPSAPAATGGLDDVENEDPPDGPHHGRRLKLPVAKRTMPLLYCARPRCFVFAEAAVSETSEHPGLRATRTDRASGTLARHGGECPSPLQVSGRCTPSHPMESCGGRRQSKVHTRVGTPTSAVPSPRARRAGSSTSPFS